ncbi:aldehyde dehydrogenase family protein [Tardiphaga sp. 215_C5_N2_1]|uniref:aldehyde dehydrogenase family protein n=1 Tax=Tardiphaga sp. 215_C5_N2_1 TaxID=3240774 RepID=UPI003F88BA5B
MENSRKFFIDGTWVNPFSSDFCSVNNPATEETVAQVALGSAADVDRAVEAARRALPVYAGRSSAERSEMLQSILIAAEARSEELALLISAEMGSPITQSRQMQVVVALSHFKEMVAVLRTYEFERFMDDTLLRREAIGVCGLITPWNWPLHQVTAKLAPALAAGCTVVVKPSEIAPLSTILFMDILKDAGVPPGVVNLVNGSGATVGEAIASHPGIAMVSFTGSTRAGILVAKAAANSVKRVVQELGGKSANVILPDADLERVVPAGVARCFANTGQSCQAPTRMLVHHSQQERVFDIAREAAAQCRVGDPLDPATTMGPLVSSAQFDRVQRFIERGIRDGATLVCGGPGRVQGLTRGYFVRPTVFGNVDRKMEIAQQEIFGPVLSIITYRTEDEAVEIANATSYGLAGYVHSGDLDRARAVAKRLQAGRIYMNGGAHKASIPMGGYKQSGNGRELGIFGLEEYLEVKAVLGYGSPA